MCMNACVHWTSDLYIACITLLHVDANTHVCVCVSVGVSNMDSQDKTRQDKTAPQVK